MKTATPLLNEWEEFIEFVGESSPRLKSILIHAVLMELSSERIAFAFKNQHFVKICDQETINGLKQAGLNYYARDIEVVLNPELLSEGMTLFEKHEEEEKEKAALENLEDPPDETPPSVEPAVASEYWESALGKQMKRLALENADYRCQICNRHHHLIVHQRTRLHPGREKLNDLTVLCQTCHTHFLKKEETCP